MSDTETRPTATPPRYKNVQLVGIIGVLVGVLLGTAGTLGIVAIVGGKPTSSDGDSSVAGSDAGGSTAADTEDAPEEPTFAPTESDFSVDITVKERQCYGSAGCNVTYRVKPDYVGVDTPTGNWEITYEVRGVEDGPIVQTFTLEDDQFSFDPEVSAETSGPNAKAKAKVTGVVEGY